MSDHCITMKLVRIYPEYDIYDDELNLNIMTEHKSIILTIGAIISILTIPIIIWEYVKCPQ